MLKLQYSSRDKAARGSHLMQPVRVIIFSIPALLSSRIENPDVYARGISLRHVSPTGIA